MSLKDIIKDLKKPNIQTLLKLLGPIALKGLKHLVNRAKTHLEKAEESKRVQHPEPTEEGVEHPLEAPTDEPTVESEVMVVDSIHVPVETPREIVWYPSPNYSSRRGSPIKAIILHHTGPGGVGAALSWLVSKDSGVSAHYVVDREGKIYQLVKESDKAWHCGQSELHGVKDINPISIGIEIVGDGKQEFTEAQYDAVAFLCKMLKVKHSIEDKWIVGHKDIAPGRKFDPHPFDWEKLRSKI